MGPVNQIDGSGGSGLWLVRGWRDTSPGGFFLKEKEGLCGRLAWDL